jgi:type IV pilus assembly protein PilY1
MLVVDDSGSMNHIIWADGYDIKTEYPDWSPMRLTSTGTGSCTTGTGYAEGWTPTTGSITISTLTNSRFRGTCGGVSAPAPADTCSSGWTRGRSTDGATTKCLRLPDPVGSGSTRYTGNYLNYLFETFADDTDLTTGDNLTDAARDYRMNVARNVATNVVNNNSNLRLGLSHFNYDNGGQVVQNCEDGSVTHTADLNAAIAALGASTWTPLAETLYEVTRYFRGMTSGYNDVPQYESPILYRCQKNFAIVITDGYPTYDANIPPVDDDDDPSGLLPNWDDEAPETVAEDFPDDMPQYSDGFNPVETSAEGAALYLDDIAKFAHDIDMRTGNDATGNSFDEGEFAKQNLVTYTIGFTAANQMLADAAEYGTGQYYQANDEATLTSALQAALTDIGRRTGSASAVASNSTRLANDTFIYQARFDKNWGGELLAYPIGPDGSVAELADNETVPVLVLADSTTRTGWNAAEELPDATDRKIYTYNPTAAAGSRGVEFLWDSLTAAQQDELDQDASGTDDNNGDDRLLYLRGEQANEAPNGLQFRARPSSVLGDIVNSDPIYVARQNYGYDVLPDEEGSSYLTYREDMADRTPVVYVAANDGMLHGFAAETGEELLAYVPNAVYPQLSALTDEAYNDNHRLINDGAPRAMDAYIDGWRTILVGSLGGGGKGIYALDVTDPENFSADDVMWEFTSADDANLGVAIPSPTIARLANGQWAALVANGYNSGGNATLFVLDLETGAVIREIDTGVSGDNGLSSPTPVDVDADRITDYVYAGDLKGNMWKFDLTSSDEDSWSVAFEDGGEPAPLYTACSSDPCTAGNRQPITARPEVGINPPEGYFVYFGTGRYFAEGDNGVGTGDNSFYAIRDKNEKGATTLSLPTPGRSNLVEQLVLDGTRTLYGTKIRITSNYPITDDKDGWYLDLPVSGERQVSTPILRGGKIIFTTVIPSGDECSAGGDSWLMELDALSGSRLASPPFDLNRDGVFDQKDMVQLDPDDPDDPWINVGGIGWDDNIVKTPGILSGCPSTNEECKYMSGSSGSVTDVKENAGNQKGRQSWRQIQ